jgi:hypothetical protein
VAATPPGSADDAEYHPPALMTNPLALPPSRPALSVGLLVGGPIGATAEVGISERFAVHVDAGASTLARVRYIGAVDVVYALWDVFGPIADVGFMMPWFGLGARYAVGRTPLHSDVPLHNTGDHFGIRVPFGISYVTRGVPVEVFVEIAPALGFIPNPLAALDGGLGVRVGF